LLKEAMKKYNHLSVVVHHHLSLVVNLLPFIWSARVIQNHLVLSSVSSDSLCSLLSRFPNISQFPRYKIAIFLFIIKEILNLFVSNGLAEQFTLWRC
jgi:hypothetical protein